MPSEQRNLATVYDLLYTQTEKGLSDIMASISHEHVNQYTGELLPPSPAAAPYAIFKQSSDTVRTSVIIGLGSKLAVLQAQQVRNITSYNEIDLELPGKQKCAYFCIVSDQDSTFDFLSSLFFSFLFIRLIRYADGYCEGGMLSTKVKFVLDEFPNCCLIPDFTKKCSTIRSRGCSVAVFFQNVGQMRNRYPDDQWQEILGACDSTVFLGCTDMLIVNTLTPNLDLATSHLPILLDIDRFPILILLAFEPLIRRGMLPSLLREPASAWPWQKWSKRSWLSAVSVIVGAVLP